MQYQPNIQTSAGCTVNNLSNKSNLNHSSDAQYAQLQAMEVNFVTTQCVPNSLLRRKGNDEDATITPYFFKSKNSIDNAVRCILKDSEPQKTGALHSETQKRGAPHSHRLP